MQQAAQGGAAEGGAASGEQEQRRGLLPGGAADSSSGQDAAGGRARGVSPLRVPTGLAPIRTQSEARLADLESGVGVGNGIQPPSATRQQQQQGQRQLYKADGESPAASDTSSSLRRAAAARENEGAAGSGQSFWRTLRDMIGDIHIVACGPERQALLMSLWLAFFNQAFASTSIINYAPQVLERAGVESHSAAALLSSTVGGSKMLGVMLSFFLVDSLGRRPLLLWGSLGCSLSLVALAAADWLASQTFLVASMCSFIFAFSVSWAGVFWVLLSELFSMSAKSPAASAATATLFLTGAVTDTLDRKSVV